jgi:hypothetical protein
VVSSRLGFLREVRGTTFELIVSDPSLHILVLEANNHIVACTYLNIIPNFSRSIAPTQLLKT